LISYVRIILNLQKEHIILNLQKEHIILNLQKEAEAARTL